MALKDKKLHYRLILLGAAGCGFLLKKFEPKYRQTVEDLFSKDFDLNCVELNVEFLDTSGSLQFPAMRQISIANANAFLLVYSIVDENSFRIVQMLIDEIVEHRASDIHKLPIVIAGNKCDLVSSNNNNNNFSHSNSAIGAARSCRSARNSPTVFAKTADSNRQQQLLMERKVDLEKVQHYLYCELQYNLNVRLIECSCKDNVNIDAIFRAYLSLAKVNVVPSYITAQSSHLGNRVLGRFGSSKARLQQATCRQSTKSLTPPPFSASKQQIDSPDSYSNNSNRFNYSIDTDHNNGACCSSSNNSPSSTSATPVKEARWPSIKRKVALRVRKSCDASFISSIKNSIVDPILQATNASSASNSPVHQTNSKLQQPAKLKLFHEQQQQPAQMRAKSSSGFYEGPNFSSPTHKFDIYNKGDMYQPQNKYDTSSDGTNDKFEVCLGTSDESRQVNLQTAIKNELIKKGEFCAKDDKIKPRSRSLIWRSTRRSNKNVDVGECLTM